MRGATIRDRIEPRFARSPSTDGPEVTTHMHASIKNSAANAMSVPLLAGEIIILKEH
jgi:hypothetical protein